MARLSTIKTHPRREDIERAISEGVSDTEVARRFAVSVSSVQRHRVKRIDAVSAVIAEDTAAPDDLLARLKELADSTRQARRIADATSAPTVRARAASSELAVLDRLLDRAGITDLSAIDLVSATGALVRTVQKYVLAHPEQAADLFALMGEHPELIDARDTLRAQLREQNKK